jgi:1-deoxy-D-xylulose-5-phosphate reductoisomerase
VRPREVILLGSTGSIGVQALDVVARYPGRFRVVGLAAGGGRLERLADQIAASGAPAAAVPSAAAAAALERLLQARGGPRCEISAGPDAAADLARRPCDVVLNGMTGFAGLVPTLAALKAGRRVALANKESLVCGGRLVTEAAGPGQLTPVDSEHSALAQACRGGRADEVRRLVVTASGGPFRGRSRAELASVGVAEALAHPTWQMGRVVTVNSATLVNKGLEVIEAALLFGVPYDAIAVVVHPQSVVHSMVEFVDGSTLAQASPPDMRLPIALSLSWPDRLDGAASPCSWSDPTAWTFEPLDESVFSAVATARLAGRAGGAAPAVYNGANEVCVDAFCAGRLPFLGIADTVAAVVAAYLAGPGAASTTAVTAGATDAVPSGAPPAVVPPDASGGVFPEGAHVPDAALSLAAIQAADAWARRAAEDLVAAAGKAVS